MKLQIPQHINKIITTLENNGYEAYVTGGCVRNAMLGIAPADWDISTSALPDEVINCFADSRVIKTGIAHGTVTLITDTEPVEITTFRIDGEYSDMRHPDSVCFTANLQNDAARRDFTVNAMSYSNRTGLIDFFGGAEDLQNKLLRCVGEPKKRFTEDPLRILRALRFAAVYGFSIEEVTANSAINLAELLQNISAERIAHELNLLVCGKYAGTILYEYKEIFGVLFNEFKVCFGVKQNTPHHNKDVWQHICCSVDNAPADLTTRLAMLMHDIGKPACKTTEPNGANHFKGHNKVSAVDAEKVMKKLKQPCRLTSDVCVLVYYHDSLWSISERGIKRLLGKIGKDLFCKLIDVSRADILAQSDYKQKQKLQSLNKTQTSFERILADGECFKTSQLAVNGNDIINMGIEPGCRVGSILKALTDIVINGDLPNEKDILLEYIKNNPA